MHEKAIDGLAAPVVYLSLTRSLQNLFIVYFVTFNLTNTFFINRECNKILVNRNFANEKQKLHFESGVLMGVGAFNLVRSCVHLVKYVFNVL